ncbi:MAG TPA: aminotransferase class V-fold PLP-dependent enzyme, partial [Mycobacteriales bacterium]
GADLAVGCTYKYLNGGPGSPAYLYVRSDLQSSLRQPIQGWFGASDQFAMHQAYEPGPGIDRFLVGTPPVLSLVGVEEGVRVLAAAGIERLRAKGQAMTSYLVKLADAGADLAVGCTYKYLNGGPGAPAYLYVRSELQESLRQPIQGWFGAADQFAMGASYVPAPGIDRFLVGTPPVLSLVAAEEGARVSAEAGIERLRDKGRAMTSYLIALSSAWLEPLGFRLATPPDPLLRGSHVSLEHPAAWQVCQALLDRGVVPDYRTPDRLRLGPAPLTTRFTEVHDALAVIRDVVASEVHLTYPAEPARVT